LSAYKKGVPVKPRHAVLFLGLICLAALPLSRHRHQLAGLIRGGAEIEEAEGIEPAPWYVPPEPFVAGAQQTVALDAAIGPNTLVNSRELCPGGRGNTQSETSMAMFGNVIVAAFNDSRGFFCTGRSRLGWAFSLDGGQSFTDGGTLPGGGTLWSNGDPTVAVGPDGTFYVAGISNNFRGMSVSRGTVGKDGITWTFPVQAVTGSGTIDKELLAVDQVSGTVYMAYGRSQRIEVIRSDDQGDTWSSPAVVAPSMGVGVFPLVAPSGRVYVAWLDGWPNPNQRMLFSSSDDGGASFSSPLEIARVCPFNVPGFNRGQVPAFPSVALDTSGGDFDGRVYVAWHSICSGDADAWLSSSDDGGLTWSDPVVINNDDPTTALQFSPTVSVDANGIVNAFFYDRRENPGTGITNVYFAQSFNGGAFFAANVRITEVATNWSATASDITPNMGDYMFSISAGSDALVIWSDGRSGDPDAYFARISP